MDVNKRCGGERIAHRFGDFCRIENSYALGTTGMRSEVCSHGFIQSCAFSPANERLWHAMLATRRESTTDARRAAKNSARCREYWRNVRLSNCKSRNSPAQESGEIRTE